MYRVSRTAVTLDSAAAFAEDCDTFDTTMLGTRWNLGAIEELRSAVAAMEAGVGGGGGPVEVTAASTRWGKHPCSSWWVAALSR